VITRLLAPRRVRQRSVQTRVVVTSAAAGGRAGTNDAQKTMGVIAVVSPLVESCQPPVPLYPYQRGLRLRVGTASAASAADPAPCKISYKIRPRALRSLSLRQEQGFCSSQVPATRLRAGGQPVRHWRSVTGLNVLSWKSCRMRLRGYAQRQPAWSLFRPAWIAGGGNVFTITDFQRYGSRAGNILKEYNRQIPFIPVIRDVGGDKTLQQGIFTVGYLLEQVSQRRKILWGRMC